MSKIIEGIQLSEKKKKPKPTSPEKWSRAKAKARSKFDVYPSAYANAYAAKEYKKMGGGWRMGESEEVNEAQNVDKHELSGYVIIDGYVFKDSGKIGRSTYGRYTIKDPGYVKDPKEVGMHRNYRKPDFLSFSTLADAKKWVRTQPRKNPDEIANIHQKFREREASYNEGVAEGSDDIEDTRQWRDAIALAKSQKAIRQARYGKDQKFYADGTPVTPEEVARRAAERKAKKQGVAEGKQPRKSVVDAILRVMPVAQEIWFHGSRATGKHRRNSDTDILVVVPDNLVGEKYLGAVRILQKLNSHFDNYDVQPTKTGTNIHRIAQEEGRLLWSKQGVAEGSREPGGAYDRGAADSWYGRGYDPQRYSNPQDQAEYEAGYSENESQASMRKDYGDDTEIDNDDEFYEDTTMRFAAEKLPRQNPYGGLKDRQFRGAIAETEAVNRNDGDGWRWYEPREEEQLDELKCWPGYTRVKGVPAGAVGSCKKKTKESSIMKGLQSEDKLDEGIGNTLASMALGLALAFGAGKAMADQLYVYQDAATQKLKIAKSADKIPADALMSFKVDTDDKTVGIIKGNQIKQVQVDPNVVKQSQNTLQQIPTSGTTNKNVIKGETSVSFTGYSVDDIKDKIIEKVLKKSPDTKIDESGRTLILTKHGVQGETFGSRLYTVLIGNSNAELDAVVRIIFSKTTDGVIATPQAYAVLHMPDGQTKTHTMPNTDILNSLESLFK